MDMKTMRDDLCTLFNRHSFDAYTNTPDYVLANMVSTQLSAYAAAMHMRDEWHRSGVIAPGITPRGGRPTIETGGLEGDDWSPRVGGAGPVTGDAGGPDY